MSTLDELQTRRAAYVAAELKILESQEYSVSDGVVSRRNRRADLEQIRAALTDIDRQIASLSPTRPGPIYLR